MSKRRQLGLSPSEHSLEHTALYERSFHAYPVACQPHVGSRLT
jgi:hypothetical protein